MECLFFKSSLIDRERKREKKRMQKFSSRNAEGSKKAG